MSGDSDTLFEKIVAGEIPSTEVYSDDEFYAFRDINPGAPTHILIIPKRRIPRVTDLNEDDACMIGRLILRANEIARREGIAEDGFRYVINCNKHGGQTVYHLHLHILGGRALSWPPG